MIDLFLSNYRNAMIKVLQCFFPEECLPYALKPRRNTPCRPSCACGACQSCETPGAQSPQLPNIRCRDGVAVYLNVSAPLSASSITVANAFNGNDGPGPWTVLGAEFAGTQQALYDVREETSGQGKQLNFTLRPIIRLRYLDSQGGERTKFLSFPLVLEQGFSLPASASGLKYHVELLGGAIPGLAVNASALSFTPSGLTLKLIAYSAPRRFAVIEGYGCQEPPASFSAECVLLQSLKYNCTVAADTFFLSGTVPYRPSASPPDQPVSLTPLDTAPNVISAQKQSDGTLFLDLAFPATLVLRNSAGVSSSQETLIYTNVHLNGPQLETGDTLLADLRARLISGPYLSGTTLSAYLSATSGCIMALSGQPARVLTTTLVDCGAFTPGCSCAAVDIEPTTAP